MGDESRKELRAVQEKMTSINVQEITEIGEKCTTLKEEVKSCLKRTDIVENAFSKDKSRMEADIKRNGEDFTELSRYIKGKIEICIEADADLKREVQLTNERMQLLADDLRLNQEGPRDL